MHRDYGNTDGKNFLKNSIEGLLSQEQGKRMPVSWMVKNLALKCGQRFVEGSRFIEVTGEKYDSNLVLENSSFNLCHAISELMNAGTIQLLMGSDVISKIDFIDEDTDSHKERVRIDPVVVLS